MIHLLWTFWAAAAMLAASGLYLVVATRDLVRTLLGVELVTKGVTLLLVLAGRAAGRPDLSQAIVVTMIVVEVVVVAVGAGLVVNAHRVHGSADAENLRKLQG